MGGLISSCCATRYHEYPVIDPSVVSEPIQDGVSRTGMVYRRRNVVDDFMSPAIDLVLRMCCCTNSIPIFHETHFLFIMGLMSQGYLQGLDINKYVNAILPKATEIERSLRRLTFTFNLLAGLQALLTIIIPFVVSVMNIFDVEQNINQTIVQTSTGLVALLLAANALLRGWTESVVRAHHSIDREATDFANLSKDYAKYTNPKYDKDRWERALHRFVVRFQKIVDEYNKNTLESRFSGKTANNGHSGGSSILNAAAGVSSHHAVPALAAAPMPTSARRDALRSADRDDEGLSLVAPVPLRTYRTVPRADDSDTDGQQRLGQRSTSSSDDTNLSRVQQQYMQSQDMRRRFVFDSQRSLGAQAPASRASLSRQRGKGSGRGGAAAASKSVPATQAQRSDRQLPKQSPPALTTIPIKTTSAPLSSTIPSLLRVPSTTRAATAQAPPLPLPPVDRWTLQAIREDAHAPRSTSAGAMSYVGNDDYTADDDSVEREAGNGMGLSPAQFVMTRRDQLRSRIASAGADFRGHLTREVGSPSQQPNAGKDGGGGESGGDRRVPVVPPSSSDEEEEETDGDERAKDGEHT